MNKVVYFSRSGNTRKVAEAVARGANTASVSIEQFDAANTDILFVGASIYAGKIDGSLRTFLEGLSPELIKAVAVFCTSAGKKTALPEIKSILEAKGISVLNDVFHCSGSFLFAHRGHPDAEDLKHAEDFAKQVCS